MYQSRRHLLQMHTTNYTRMSFIRNRRFYEEEKNMSQ